MKYLRKTTATNLKHTVNKVNDLYFSKETTRFFRSSIKNVYSNKQNNFFLLHEKTIMPSGEPCYFVKVMFIINNKLEVETLDCTWSDALYTFQNLGTREEDSISNAKTFTTEWNDSKKSWIYSIGDNCDILLGLIGKSDRIIVG